MSYAQIIIIDFDSVVSEDKVSPSIKEKVAKWLAEGSTVYFLAGRARDPFRRQKIERLLEANEVKSCFVTHSVPDRFDFIVTSRALWFPFE